MPLYIIKDDITKLANVDVIVNAANNQLRPGGGVTGAIQEAIRGHGFAAEGRGAERQYLLEQDAVVSHGRLVLQTGEARITHAPGLPFKAVIHAVGPIYDEKRPATGMNSNRELLQQAYLSALDIFEGTGYQSIAFPLLSSGIYRFPVKEAAVVAVDTLQSWLRGQVRNAADGYREPQVHLIAYDIETYSLLVKIDEDRKAYTR